MHTLLTNETLDHTSSTVTFHALPYVLPSIVRIQIFPIVIERTPDVNFPAFGR